MVPVTDTATLLCAASPTSAVVTDVDAASAEPAGTRQARQLRYEEPPWCVSGAADWALLARQHVVLLVPHDACGAAPGKRTARSPAGTVQHLQWAHLYDRPS